MEYQFTIKIFSGRDMQQPFWTRKCMSLAVAVVVDLVANTMNQQVTQFIWMICLFLKVYMSTLQKLLNNLMVSF